MRPQILFPLFAAIESLHGIGPKIARLVERLAGPKALDLLWHLPSGVIDRRRVVSLREAQTGSIVTLTLRIDGHIWGSSARAPHRVRASDPTGKIDLVFFHAQAKWLETTFPIGQTRIVSGRIEQFQGSLQMPHPDRVGTLDERDAIAVVEPIYPLTAGLQPRTLAKVIADAVARAPELPEWQDAAWLQRRGWMGWQESLRRAHAPEDTADLLPVAPARQRLAYDELLANQLALALFRRSTRQRPGRPTTGDGSLRQQVEAALPFALTNAQRLSLAEIYADMAAPNRMLRLLQGDVGSGKTVVALLAMLAAVEDGRQAALLAPTEILARQHRETLAALLQPVGLEPGLLTGRDKGKVRKETLAGLADGSIRIVVGTHALFQESVEFADLAVAVIDEQHRFGVHQRLQLSAKGEGVDVLVMTATPIPRTLQLTAYGDMDVSKLTEKPPGRTPVDTRAISAERIDEVVAGIGRHLTGGGKAYWVCPLVEESETSDLAAATDRCDDLRRMFGEKVGLVHGKMKAAEKDAVMAGFAEGGIDLLIATTVIEVGVNVPAATVMVIEHAERFGLAQLHQLRGRVGRGDAASRCILLYSPPLSETSRQRLATIRETEDGFRIAEEDLRLRGAGEVLGTRQSGLPEFRVADIDSQGDLLAVAKDDVALILNKDPELEGPRGQALRTLLYLFEHDSSAKYLRAG
ncbi:MAG: ATP-dependent DNA helicase RecG [Inquilinus sp.]|uniref:ATP-dependent DNA helicase RecG n=1 Tax=Inquilinus sp. TaxID=1932117 RepID=UPI003F2F3463